MKVLFAEYTIQPFPHGRPGERFTVRFEPVTNFSADAQLYTRGWGLDVPGVVAEVSGGPGITVQGLRLRAFELSTTTDSSAPEQAAWRALILDGAGALVERWRPLQRLRLAPDIGTEDARDGLPVRRATLPEAFEASAAPRRPPVGPAVSAAVDLTAPLPSPADAPAQADPRRPTPVKDTTGGGG